MAMAVIPESGREKAEWVHGVPVVGIMPRYLRMIDGRVKEEESWRPSGIGWPRHSSHCVWPSMRGAECQKEVVPRWAEEA